MGTDGFGDLMKFIAIFTIVSILLFVVGVIGFIFTRNSYLLIPTGIGFLFLIILIIDLVKANR